MASIKKHPTKDRMQKVIDRLNSVVPYARGKAFDINAIGLNITGAIECGTPHCVGGWYAVASRARKAMKQRMQSYCNYQDGADLMAKDLGFSCHEQLESWAKQNPELWGNKQGSGIFCSTKAYGRASSLKGIVKHLQGVLERLPA